MTPVLSETAYAKINLALHVRNRRADGYHTLETLFVFAATGDRLTVEAADTVSIDVAGPFAAGLSTGNDNLVVRAAAVLAKRLGIARGAHFTLEKHLPVASGIGGGSADAAAALRLAARLWDADLASLNAEYIAAELGADVPACMTSHSCFATGIGEQLHPVNTADFSGMPLLLVNPLIACPTGPVFRAWDGVDRGPLFPHLWREGRNDLQRPAIALHPVIAEVLDRLQRTGPQLARMSGSGATCFALYADTERRDAARDILESSVPAWWTMATHIR